LRRRAAVGVVIPLVVVVPAGFDGGGEFLSSLLRSALFFSCSVCSVSETGFVYFLFLVVVIID
jgi:hypothetical protein